ncbi:hypothetical protein Airi02_034740 [Actinoallomurus iriomotensis]|uniref:Uncharacterized protein n=1 Tax=Actinoallomurus iriomotensis TaxID=478107 RepID=A0A9W6S084_9ACTN|nr:helix-turn-helix domain-containing protein [Actinoallomurus iriomotensis]GLY85545.1 hypothetical protein Airi02_034740 [Actinoallomurus iriomotensis]
MIHAFNERGLACLDPKWAGGRPRLIGDDDIAFIVETATTRPARLGRPFTHWSIRKLADFLATDAVRRVRTGRERLRLILHARGITFQRTRTWKESRDRRERAAGAWLPEPLLDGDPMLDPAGTFEQRESVSLAVLTLASQQHLHRARRRFTAARRRGGEVDPAATRRIVEEFLAAASSGRTERLVALLTEDAIAISDGAGLAEKLLRYDTPQRIAAVARAGFMPTPAKRRFAGGAPAIHYALVNGDPAVLFVIGDQVIGAVTFDITGGKIATVRGIAAPTRPARLTEAWRRHGPDTPLIGQW